MASATSALLAPGNWPAFVLISARMSGLMLLAPFWSMVSIPKSVKGAVVVVLSALLVPTAARPAFPDHFVQFPLPLMMEFTLGLGIGIAAAVVVHALILASEVVALQTGLSLGQVLTPNIDTGGPALGQIYGLLGLAVFVAAGGPVMMIEALARSVVQHPPGVMISFADGPIVLLRLTGSLFGYAIQIVGPVMVALTVTNVAMAILSRAVPQLNAMAMSFAVTLGVGFVIIGLSLPVLLRVLGRWFVAVGADTDALVGAMVGAGVR